MSDINAVNHPTHYQGSIECIDAIDSALEGMSGPEAFSAGNVIKYVWRHKEKNGVQDLEKAEWYLQHLIKLETKKE